MFPWLWFQIPWGSKINTSKDLKQQMSAWELVGPLVALCCGEEHLRNKELECFVDNQGSCTIFSKGYSSKDPLSNTLVKAIGEVATALACTVFITKVSRCSSPETECGDALSKNEVDHFMRTANKILHKYDMEEVPRIPEHGISVCPSSTLNTFSVSSCSAVPNSITDWLSDPKPDRFLGHRILEEMANNGVDLLGYSR